MKKTLSLILVVVLLMGTVLTLASCATTLSGTYSNDDTGTTYKFSGSKYTRTAPSLLGGTNVMEGKYDIIETDDGYEIAFFQEDTPDGEKMYYPFAKGEENGEKYISIMGVKYFKD